MQASCPSCSHKIVIDDAKVPDRPFSVKCPKCQNPIKLPGKAAAAAPAAAPPLPEEPEPPAAGAAMEEMRAQMMAQLRREMAPGSGAGSDKKALVALADRGQASQAALLLTRQGMAVDTMDNPEEGGRLLEQGLYDLVVTNKAQAPQGKPETLYQRISRMSPDNRRRLFLILVGDEFKSGDGTQGWVTSADLVLAPRDLAGADGVLRNIMAERQRLYQVYLDCKRRQEEATH